MIESARYLEDKQMFEQAVTLYQKGGQSSKASLALSNPFRRSVFLSCFCFSFCMIDMPFQGPW